MLKGDLVTAPLPQVLRQLADSTSTGCLHVLDARGEEGRVYLRGGLIYAVQVPGQRPLLGQHLVSSGALGPEMLAEALEAQRTELQGWKLGELLVHLGYVDAPVVEEFLAEQVRDQAGDLLRWPTGTWKFRVNERTREDVARPTPVEELLEDCVRRATEWELLTDVIHGPEAVPVLSAEGNSDAEMAIDPEAWSLLCKVDGARTLAGLAVECGFTLYEAGRVVHSLVRSGLLDVEEPVFEQEPVPAGSVSSRLLSAFAPADGTGVMIPAQAEEHSAADMADLISSTLRDERTVEGFTPASTDDADGSLDRMSAALSAMLGPTTDDALFAPRPRKESKPELTEAQKAKAERDKRRRDRDAAELAEAHQAELDAARNANERPLADEPFSDEHRAEIVSLADVRREAARREQESADATAAKQAQQARRANEAERQRLTDEAERLEQEKAELAEQRAHLKEQKAAAEQAKAVAAEAKAAAEQEKAARAEEERLRLAEQERLAELERIAEQERRAEAARAEEARLAEDARLAEEQRLQEAEQARLDELRQRQEEQARLAEAGAELEREKAQLAAEVAALEEETRLAEDSRLAEEAAEAAEAARLAEAARVAESARLAAEEAAAVARADEAAAAAAEAARLAEEARFAAEAAEAMEALRLEQQDAAAATAEAARVADAAAAELVLQLVQEQATERARLEEELRRESEAQHAAALAETARLEAEATALVQTDAQAQAEADQQEQARLAAQRTAASAAFSELSATAASAPEAVAAALPSAEPTPEPEDDAEPTLTRNADTDMAAMFRELSSLGVEDEPAAPPPPPRPAARPVTPIEKKKRGIFGR